MRALRPTRAQNTKETHMAKGQKRGNKEIKKPKQPKKVPTPGSSSIVPPRNPVPGKPR